MKPIKPHEVLAQLNPEITKKINEKLMKEFVNESTMVSINLYHYNVKVIHQIIDEYTEAGWLITRPDKDHLLFQLK